MVSVFRPDTFDDLLFDRDFNVDGVALLLVFVVALLVGDLFTVQWGTLYEEQCC